MEDTLALDTPSLQVSDIFFLDIPSEAGILFVVFSSGKLEAGMPLIGSIGSVAVDVGTMSTYLWQELHWRHEGSHREKIPHW